MNLIKDEIILKSRIVTKEQLVVISKNEFKLQNNPKRDFFHLGVLHYVFRKRQSNRNLQYLVKADEVIDVINDIRNDKQFRPTPFAGNVDCIDICVYNYPENEAYLIPADYNRKSRMICDDEMLQLFMANIQRPEYRFIEGVYIFFFTSADKLQYKYRDMAEPLLYTTLGCLIQNITLTLCYNDIHSCIHFGMRKQIETQLDGWEYYCPCFMKVGK